MACKELTWLWTRRRCGMSSEPGSLPNRAIADERRIADREAKAHATLRGYFSSTITVKPP